MYKPSSVRNIRAERAAAALKHRVVYQRLVPVLRPNTTPMVCATEQFCTGIAHRRRMKHSRAHENVGLPSTRLLVLYAIPLCRRRSRFTRVRCMHACHSLSLSLPYICFDRVDFLLCRSNTYFSNNKRRKKKHPSAHRIACTA